ncbi:LMBR1 domain-containing protein 2 homolog [Planococcus citri]|uniref:LMBR1 domain-containing protein 2 homolog n=1 Tax=Planococcus citri TaxID=170843 RepID=UPI0031F79153
MITPLSLLVEIVVVFVITALLLHKYGDWKRQNAMIILVVLISWYFSLLTVFVLPLDISSTTFRQCMELGVENASTNGSHHSTTCKEPWSYVPEEVLPRLWRIVYWSSQFLTWILLPLMQSYARAGDFTFYEKLKSALKDNILYYGSYVCLCVICLFYIILYTDIPLDGSKLRAIASSASNTWGLFLLIILLGYALVDVPRKLWFSGNPQLCLLRSYFQVSKLTSDFYDAEAELKNLIQRIYITEARIPENDPLRVYVDIVCSIIPVQFHLTAARVNSDRSSTTPSPTKEVLVQYHKQLKSALHTYRRTHIQRERMFDQVYELQKIISNRKEDYQNYKDYLVQGPFQWPGKWRLFCFDYLWAAMWKPVVMKVLSTISIVMSAAVVWSESTFFKENPVLSVFALLIRGSKSNYNYAVIEILCAVTLAYLCYCAYSTVFKIRIFNYYHFAPDHQTDENSLIFSGMLLSRLTPPLCLNFLGLIHMDSHIIKKRILETQYTQIMGHMDVISIISNGFNIYFPMVMIIISTATYFNIGSHLLSAIGFPQYFADDEITEDIVTEGQRLALAEKDKRLRRGLLSPNELPESTNRNENSSRSRRFKRDYSSTDESSFNSSKFEMNLQASSPRETFPSKNIFDDV